MAEKYSQTYHLNPDGIVYGIRNGDLELRGVIVIEPWLPSIRICVGIESILQDLSVPSKAKRLPLGLTQNEASYYFLSHYFAGAVFFD